MATTLMKIEDFLAQGDVAVDVKATSKAQALAELSERGGARLHIEPAHVLQELQKREDLGSTGVGAGIAIPHARFHDVSKPLGCLVRLRRAIDFEAIDAMPVDLLFLLLLPAAPQGDGAPLAAVARKLREPERVARLREAADAPALYAALLA